MAISDLALFAHVVQRPDADINLAEASLVVAQSEYPELNVARYMRRLDELGSQARLLLSTPGQSAADTRSPRQNVERVLQWLYQEVGFHGNTVDYYDPKNSFLNEVIDRLTGIPITLAIVVIETLARAGFDAGGIAFPGHFLVRVAADEPIVIDPFQGCILSAEDVRQIYSRATGTQAAPEPRLLQAASNRVILARLLNNLRNIYASRPDGDRLRDVLERIQLLLPSEAYRRELEQMGGSRLWMSKARGIN